MIRPWQARSSEFHPYMVDSVEALPASLRDQAKAALPPGATVVRALFVPRDYRARGWSSVRQTPEQALIFTDAGVLHVQRKAKDGSERAPMFVRPDNLLYMRSSHLLLYGRLELVSSVDQQPVRLDMEFNAVGWRLMDTEWRNLVGKIIGLPPIADGAQPADDSDRLLPESLPSKFAFGLRKYGLYTGESLLGAVYQPGIWDKHWALFPKQITANTLLVLTNASVIIIDEDRALVRKSQQYGFRITRIPRPAIAGSDAAENDGLPELTFSLARGEATTERRLQLEPETAQQWLALWQQQQA